MIVEAVVVIIGIIGSVALKDYLDNIFPKQAPRWFWSKTKKILPKKKRREVYRSFIRGDYRYEKSMIIKVYMVVKTTLTLKDNDDDDFPSC